MKRSVYAHPYVHVPMVCTRCGGKTYFMRSVRTWDEAFTGVCRHCDNRQGVRSDEIPKPVQSRVYAPSV